MELKDFLLNYRLGVRAATGKVLSVSKLVRLMLHETLLNTDFHKKFEKRYEAWEAGKGKPKTNADREIVKTFFGIAYDDFDNIDPTTMHEAVLRYPSGLVPPLEPRSDIFEEETNSKNERGDKKNIGDFKPNLIQNELKLPVTQTEIHMLHKTFDMLEKRMNKDDERWDKLLATHDKLVDFIGSLGLKYTEEVPAKKRHAG